MTIASVVRAAVIALGGALAVALGYSACGGQSSSAPADASGGTAGNAGDAKADAPLPADAGSDADAAPPPWGTLPPWDPVWHETAPHQWPEVPHDKMPDCGAGCTPLTAYWPHSFIPFSIDGDRVAYNTVQPDVYTLMVDLDTLTEYLIDDGKKEPHLANDDCEAGIPALSGDYILYAITCKSHSRIVLRSLKTGESKTVMLFGPMLDGSPGNTGLTPTHAYWYYGNTKGPNSISSFDLTTGEVKTTNIGICRTIWFRPGPKGDEVLCTDEDIERILMIDIAHHKYTPLSPSSYAQNYGYLSPDGTQAVWYDYRDPGPNGQHGSYEFEYAGEIYWKNLVTGEQKRITFDNPSDPVKKQFPSIRNGVIAWQDWRTEAIKNPQGGTGFATQAAPIRYQTGPTGTASNCPILGGLNPEMTSKGILVNGGGTMPDGSPREALVLLACQ